MLNDFGVRQALGEYAGLIELPISLVLTNVIDLLPAKILCLELYIDIEITEDIITRLIELKKIGFRLGYCGLPAISLPQSFLDLLDLIRVDPSISPTESVGSLMQQLSKAKSAELIAERVNTESDFNACKQIGFQLFQGDYFSSESLLKLKNAPVSKTTLLRLVGLLMNDEPINKIDQAFQISPDLCIRLLKLVNSVGMGGNSRVQITSIKQAILRIGQNQLLRWALLLLYSRPEHQTQSLLFKRVMYRARFMEQCAGNTKFIQPNQSDQAYIVGMLSLADFVTDTPIVEILEQIGLEDKLQAAILEHKGVLGKLLNLALEVEQNQFATMRLTAHSLGLSGQDISQTQLDTMIWLNSLEKQLT